LREQARSGESSGWEHLATGMKAALGELAEVLSELAPLLARATAGLVGVVGGVGLGLGLLAVGLRGLGWGLGVLYVGALHLGRVLQLPHLCAALCEGLHSLHAWLPSKQVCVAVGYTGWRLGTGGLRRLWALVRGGLRCTYRSVCSVLRLAGAALYRLGRGFCHVVAWVHRTLQGRP
jgi:hypothetical protein